MATIQDIRITSLCRTNNISDGDLLLAATCLNTSPTTQAVSACVVLNYLAKNGPYSLGPNVTGTKFNPASMTCTNVVIDPHYNIVPSHPPEGYFQDPNRTYDSYYSNIGGGVANVIWGQYSSVVGGCQNFVGNDMSMVGSGKNNKACEDYSVIGGGEANISCGVYSTIVGGLSNLISTGGTRASITNGWANKACGLSNFIGNGYCNVTKLDYSTITNGYSSCSVGVHSTIVNGRCNKIDNVTYSSIVNGNDNKTSGAYATIIGGSTNTASGACSLVGNGNLNSAQGEASFIGNGSNNTASGSYSTIVGGCSSTASGIESFVGSGCYNKASGQDSFIGTGQVNAASGSCSTIVNGYSSIASGIESFIGNGQYNKATNSQSTIVNGYSSIASGIESFIGNGQYNKATNSQSTIVNGELNKATADYSTIVNGYSGQASGEHSFIGNGYCNNATANYSTIVNGYSSKASGNKSFIGNGDCNNTKGANGFIGTGYQNTIEDTTEYSFIANGVLNTASGNYSTIVGGYSSKASGIESFIGSGCCNNASGQDSFIGTGRVNAASGNYSTIVGGYSSKASGIESFIGSGCCNNASGQDSFIGTGRVNAASGNYSTIVNGYSSIASGNYSTIVGGYSSKASGCYSFIGNGECNTSNGTKGFLGNGFENIVSNNYSTIVNGVSNIASNNYSTIVNGFSSKASGANSFIGGGSTNLAAGSCSTIIQGNCNVVNNNFGSIINGECNTSSANYSFIANGNCNTANGADSFIGNGFCHSASGQGSFIGSGSKNTASSTNAFIGNGSTNAVSGDHSTIVGGYSSRASGGYSFIGNGQYNNVKSEKGFIGAGYLNTIDAAANESFIASGTSNTASHPNTYILGSNITTTQANTTYVENLCANSWINTLSANVANYLTVGDKLVVGDVLDGTTAAISGKNISSSEWVNTLSANVANYLTVGDKLVVGDVLDGTTAAISGKNISASEWVNTLSANVANYLTVGDKLVVGDVLDARGANITATDIRATNFYGNGEGITGITATSRDNSKLPLSGGVLTDSLTGTNAYFTSTVSAQTFYGDGSHLAGLLNPASVLQLTGGTLTGGLTGTTATFTASVSSPALSGTHYGDGSKLTGVVLSTGGTITGDLNITGNLSAQGTTTQIDTMVFVTSAVSVTNTGTGPALYVKQTGSNDVASFYDDTTSALIIKDGGNVGIGDSSPDSKLSVYSTSNNQAAVIINQTGTAPALVVEDSTSPDSTPFVVDASGNVSVGTLSALSDYSNATLKLSIAGAGASQRFGAWCYSTSKFNAPVFSFNRSITNTLGLTGTPTEDGTNVGLIDFSYYSKDGVLRRSASIQCEVEGNDAVSGSSPGRLSFLTATSGSQDASTKMIINNAGNVGIGDTSPGSKLSVYSTSNTEAAVTITQTGAANALVVEDSTNPDSTPFTIDADGNVLIGLSATFASPLNPPFQISRAGSSGAMFARFTNDGTCPVLRFAKSRGTTNGTFNAGISSGDNIGSFDFFGDSGALSATKAAYMTVEADGLFTASSAPSRFVLATTVSGSTTPTERFRIDNAGNIGIGDTSPNSKLSVYSTSNTEAAVTITQTGTANALVVEDSTSPDTSPFVIDGNGNVLIGLSATYASPFNFPFQISSTTSSGITLARFSNNSTSPGIRFAKSRGTVNGTFGGGLSAGDNIGVVDFYGDNGASSSTRAAWIAVDADGLFTASSTPSRFGIATTAANSTTPTERLRITSAGLVGVGTASPNEELTVVGNISAQGNISSTFFGSNGFVKDALNPGISTFKSSNSRFDQPAQAAFDSSGNLYISNNRAIRKITPAGVVSTFAGSPGQLGTINGTGTAARFNSPCGMAFDSSGNLFVADCNNNNIRKITPAGVVTNFAGSTTGLAGSTNSTTGSVARFYGPLGVAIDSSNNLFVTDSLNNTIRKITSAGAVTTFAGTVGSAGDTDGAGIGTATFWGPHGITIDSSNSLYVADSINAKIRKITSGAVVSTLATLALAEEIDIDSSGNLFVSNNYNHVIYKVTSTGTSSVFAGTLDSPGSTDGSSNTQFYGPLGVAVDRYDNVFISDQFNHTIRRITSAGVVSTVAGETGTEDTVDDAFPSVTYYTDRVILDNNANRVNVGIGTSSPSERLTVVGSVSASSTIYSNTPIGLVINSTSYPQIVLRDSGTTSLDGTNRWAVWNGIETVSTGKSFNIGPQNTGGSGINMMTFTRHSSSSNTAGLVSVNVNSGAGMFSTGNMLLGQNDGGSYFGRTGIKENHLVTTNSNLTAVSLDPVDTNVRQYRNIAMSSGGRYQIAVTEDAGIWRSVDYGVSWAQVDSNIRPYYSVAMSADGKYVTVGLNSGSGIGLYRSTDYGVNWAVSNTTATGVFGAAMSSDGRYQTAVDQGVDILRSVDFGATWMSTGAGALNWRFVAMSSDGRYQTAVIESGGVYRSTDYGVTWTSVYSTAKPFWSIAMSSDGRYQTAAYSNQASTNGLLKSTNYGASWTDSTNSTKHYGWVAMSSDGRIQAVAELSGSTGISKSVDGGTTWTVVNSTNRLYYGLAMSSDGKIMSCTVYAGSPEGGIYRSATDSTLNGGLVITSTSNETDINLINTSISGRNWRIGTGGSSGGFSNGSFGIYDATAATTRMLISSNGLIGVGTSTPTEKFTVSGNISASGNVIGQGLLGIEGGSTYTGGSLTAANFYGGLNVLNNQATFGSSLYNLGIVGGVFDSKGNCFIVDQGNNNIRKITPYGVVTRFAGGTTGSVYGSTDGSGTTARFNAPQSITIDPNDNLYVIDYYNNTIRKITSAGVVSTLAGTVGVGSYVNGNGIAATFSNPHGLIYNKINGNLYVTDTANYAIRQITLAGVVTTFAGVVPGGTQGTTAVDATGSNARFLQPWGITTDSVGNLFLTDPADGTIRKITTEAVVTTFAGVRTGSRTSPVEGAGLTAAKFTTALLEITTDSSNNLYVCELNAIRKITTAAVVSLFAGSYTVSGYVNSSGSSARFLYPSDIFYYNSYLYVRDQAAGCCIRRISLTGSTTLWAGNPTSNGISDGVAIGGSVTIDVPINSSTSQIEIAPDLVVDKNLTIGRNFADLREIDQASVLLYGGSYFACNPYDVNEVYFSDSGNNVIRKLNLTTREVSLYFGLPNTSGSTDGDASNASFFWPTSLAINPSNGDLYVSDNANHTIRKITYSTGLVSTIAGLAGGSGSANGIGSAARFNDVRDLVLNDTCTELYACDTTNHNIRKIVLATNTVSDLAGSAGNPGTTNGTGAAARFYGPISMSKSPGSSTETLYVVDSGNLRCRKIIISSGTVSDFGTAATWSDPYSIFTDTDGISYVIDYDIGMRKITSPANSAIISTYISSPNGDGTPGLLGSGGKIIGYAADFIKIPGTSEFLLSSDLGKLQKIYPTGIFEDFIGGSGVSGYQEGTPRNHLFQNPIDARGGIRSQDGYLSIDNDVYINGALRVAGPSTTSSYTVYSDKRLKENITPLTNSLEKIISLNGITFNWNKDAVKIGEFSQNENVGVLAQEVEEVLPQIISDYRGYKTVKYDGLIPLLIESIKELKKEMDVLKDTNSQLLEKISKL